MRVLTADRPRSDPSVRRRWAALLALSTVFHAAVLGTFALRLPAIGTHAEPSAMNVSLVPPRYVQAVAPPSAPPAVETRVVVLPTAPRYAAPARARTGEGTDAADLFGPVFADGMWPRPLLVKSEPCDPEDAPERLAACRRDLMLIGLASEPEARSKAQP